MDQEPLQHAEEWAVKTFGAAELGDLRRTDRLIKVASALAANPSASLPHALQTWGETQGASRLLGNDAISYQEILLPHWSQIYHEATQCSRTLLLADTTEFDFTTHQALKGRGPIGNSKEHIGFSLHTVLAMDPQTQHMLGCMTLEPFIRQLAPLGETKAHRQKRKREAQVWEHSVQQIGRVPQKRQWISVGESGSDVSTFWQTCEELGYDFVLRVAQDRDGEIPEENGWEEFDEKHLKTLARLFPATDAHVVSIPAHHHQPKREALLQMNFQKVRVQPPVHGACFRKTEITAWVVRVWETHPPEGQEPLEWILLTTLPIMCPGDGWQVVQWYGHDSYPRAIRETLGSDVLHRTNRYLNNRLEQDHRGIKQRYDPLRGFGGVASAARFCRAFDEVRQFLRVRTTMKHQVPLAHQREVFCQRLEVLKAMVLVA